MRSVVNRKKIMSNNIGKKPVVIKEGVTVTILNDVVTVNGPKGSLSEMIPEGVFIELTDNEAQVKKTETAVNADKFTGLVRALLSNMVQGVTTGFEKKLELSGVGYRAKIEGKDLVLNVGYANAVRVSPPDGVTIRVEENNIIIAGANKAIIGDLASKIRSIRVPDPYKAKGIKYEGEKIRRKVGKAAKAVGGTK